MKVIFSKKDSLCLYLQCTLGAGSVPCTPGSMPRHSIQLVKSRYDEGIVTVKHQGVHDAAESVKSSLGQAIYDAERSLVALRENHVIKSIAVINIP